MGRKSKRKSKPTQQSKNLPSNNYANILKSPIINTNSHQDKIKLLCITDRLNLPIFNATEIEDEYTELQLDFRPRPYFVNGLCCFCSKKCSTHNYPCENCHMVSYCSSKHRQQHISIHEQLCRVLSKICTTGLTLARGLDADDYRSFRLELLSLVQTALGRRLELWEREILLYPRLCRICRTCDNLQSCTKCGIEFSCGPEHFIGHDDYCDEFQVFGRIIQSQFENGFAAPFIPDFHLGNLDCEKLLPNDFDNLVKMIYGKNGEYEKIDCGSYAALSQSASPALTALHAIQCIQRRNSNELNCKSMKIHVIGAELQFECANITVWEKLFLHLMPGLRNLRLEFYGPELQVPDDIAAILRRPKLCNRCCLKGCKIDVTFHCGKLYHQINTDRPDFVCLFNPGLYRTTGFANQDTWPKTIEKFCDYDVPILVTSYTEIELPRDLDRIREFRELKIEQEPQRNPFASLRPERNFVSDDVVPLIYKNYFFSIARGIPSVSRLPD